MKITTIALVAFAGLSLAACGSKEEAPEADVNMTNLSVPADTVIMNMPTETPMAAPTANAVEAVPTPSPDITPEAQTEDDAAAAGMTSRVSRDEGNENAPQPVQ